MATEFEKLVYEKVRGIPRGRVTSYGEIARAIGRDGASRAVGNALNRNPHPIEVPCHRVVRSDKRLGGFAGGSDMKRRLLEMEGVVVENGVVNGGIFSLTGGSR